MHSKKGWKIILLFSPFDEKKKFLHKLFLIKTKYAQPKGKKNNFTPQKIA